MTLFTDTSFSCSITLTAKEWDVVVLSLLVHKESDLAKRVKNQIGRKPE